jgi:hypothetical protein
MSIFLSLHTIAAPCGDGLHPELLRAMSRANDLRHGPHARSPQAMRRAAELSGADIIILPRLVEHRGEDARRAREAGAGE